MARVGREGAQITQYLYRGEWDLGDTLKVKQTAYYDWTWNLGRKERGIERDTKVFGQH